MGAGQKIDTIKHLGIKVDDIIAKYLRPLSDIWQPDDFLPFSHSTGFFADIKTIQEQARSLSYDTLAVLIGNTITEEALPTYLSWLLTREGVDSEEKVGWSKWARYWAAEENRHGDVLNRYLYLCGRVNMREVEASIQHLISCGFEPKADLDPYKSFVYTSFQELATNIAHRRVAAVARKTGNELLARICGSVAGDEARHASAYIYIVNEIIARDPNGMIIAFEEMMKARITMPAHNMSELGKPHGKAFVHFANAAQRSGIYTFQDYIDVTESLLNEWQIEKISNLNDKGKRAQGFLIKHLEGLKKASQRIKAPDSNHVFNWILDN